MSLSAKTVSGIRFVGAVTLGLVFAQAAIAPAFAQRGATPKARHLDQNGEKPSPAQPDAVPGAKPREPAAPATKPATDMSPNEALFDAINRGDIAAARDATNRGAELNATNVLGMTPLELSVDLGRNDISFMLLSLRGEDSGRGSRAVAKNQEAPSPKAAPAKTAAVQARPGVTGKELPVAEKPMVSPKLFANDGGAPVPSAGFLGFGGRATAN
jgi:hypothetical protein